MSTEHLRFSPDILARLGEELIPHVDQGIIELVKNSYDADSNNCTIELNKVDSPGGKIIIIDDGIGMSSSDIKTGWLLIGKSGKSVVNRTEKGRLPVGDKGLGRLAGLRLGKKVELITRPLYEPGIEYTLKINWDDFERTDYVEEIPLEIKSNKSNKKPGTELIIKDLRQKLGRREIDRLAKQLVLLSDPFEGDRGFQPVLKVPGFKDLQNKVSKKYFDNADYYLSAEIDEEGNPSAIVKNWKGEVQWESDSKSFSKDKYNTVSTAFEVWVYLLDTKTLSLRGVTKKEVQEWLGVRGGIHFYHRGIRVRPYGEPGYDWLDLNLARARSPEERPSTNTVIGRVSVDDLNLELAQKTDRIGFIETSEFHEIRNFAIDAMDWLAKKRMKVAEEKRKKTKEKAEKKTRAARKQLSELIETSVPKSKKPELQKAFEKYESAYSKLEESLRQDMQLYRSLATAGTTAAIFAHETAKPVTQIEKTTQIIKKRLHADFGQSLDEKYQRPLDLLSRSTQSLKTYASFPIYLLKHTKRKFGIINIHQVLSDVIEAFDPYLKNEKIEVITDFIDYEVVVEGTVALLEAIITNLLTNAINTFVSSQNVNVNRKIVIKTILTGKHVLIRVMDNGPGIKGISIDDMWLPGRTTKRGGTGFGLTIVKDATQDLGGSIYAVAQGELGGAEFVLDLPAGP